MTRIFGPSLKPKNFLATRVTAGSISTTSICASGRISASAVGSVPPPRPTISTRLGAVPTNSVPASIMRV